MAWYQVAVMFLLELPALIMTFQDLMHLKSLLIALTNDGGIVEDMYAISRGAIKKALFYLSSASDYLRAEQAVYMSVLLQQLQL